MKQCQACENGQYQAELILVGENSPYKLCMNCLHDLNELNLSPEQFKNLLANGHSNTEFLLHNDFYDEDGDALQPH